MEIKSDFQTTSTILDTIKNILLTSGQSSQGPTGPTNTSNNIDFTWQLNGPSVYLINNYTLAKLDDSAEWQNAGFSQEGFSKNISVSFQPNSLDRYFIAGLTENKSPINENLITYGWFLDQFQRYTCRFQNINIAGPFSSYNLSDIFEIKYDGKFVYYLKNQEIIFSTQRTVGPNLYLGIVLGNSISMQVDNIFYKNLTNSGPTGIIGIIGESGVQGPAGISGAEGPTGISGAEGPTGTSGAEGPTGTSGAEGPSGTSGTEGPTGTSGTEGPTGISGVQGPTGISGVQGPTGNTGYTNNVSYSGYTGLSSLLAPIAYAKVQINSVSSGTILSSYNISSISVSQDPSTSLANLQLFFNNSPSTSNYSVIFSYNNANKGLGTFANIISNTNFNILKIGNFSFPTQLSIIVFDN